jgi:tetratricopeptide (TPR) repeat protein
MDDALPTVGEPVGPMSETSSPAPAVPPAPTGRPRVHLLGPCLILALALLAYAPTLGNGFPFDDERFVVQNTLIISLRHLPILLISPYWAIDPGAVKRGGILYRPLLTISFALNYAVGGLQPLGYHVVNLLLHAGVSLAVYGVGRRLFLSRPGATVAGVLFAVHPLHTEAVAGIVGRAELLMALGVLLALAMYRGSKRYTRVGSLVAFALGLLAKEQAMVLPALLALCELSTRLQSSEPRSGRTLVRPTLVRLIPYCGILGAYLLLRIWVLGGFAGGTEVQFTAFLDNPLAHVALGPRLLTALAVAGRYLRLCLWPVPLSPDYSYNQVPLATSPLDGRVLVAVLSWAILCGIAIRSFQRGRGAAGVAVGFTLLTFLPASNLLLAIGTIMGERLFYLPSAGICWLAGLGWETAQEAMDRPRFRLAAWGILGVLFLAFTAQAVRYGRLWRDDFTLFSYAVTAAPESAKIRFNLGSDLLFKNRKEEAIAHLRRAVEIYPSYTQAWDALGRAYLDTKRWEEAVAAFGEALLLASDYPHSHNNLGLAFAALGRWDEAMAAFRRAVALKPDLAQAHRNLADAYDRRGWSEAALAERALELNPTDALAWLQAGTTFLQLRWPAEALVALQEAVRLGPALPEVHLRLAQAYDTLNRPADAAAAYEALLRFRPNLPAVHRRLAELYTAQLHDPAKAQSHLRQAEGVGR